MNRKHSVANIDIRCLARLPEDEGFPHTIRTPDQLCAWFYHYVPALSWWNPDVEHVIVLTLTSKYRITACQQVTRGLSDQCLIHPAEIFRPAIATLSKALLVIHNHPSGDPSPSGDDLLHTRDLVKAGKILGIHVLDHIIIGRPPYNAFCSLRDSGLVDFNPEKT